MSQESPPNDAPLLPAESPDVERANAPSIRLVGGEEDARELISQIRTVWQSATASIIETGRLLNQAKETLKHGRFLQMVEGDLPFGARAAQELMRIARHPVLSDAQHVAHLPPSWGTLAALARVPVRKLASLIESKTVTPQTTRAEAVRLARPRTRARAAADRNEPSALADPPASPPAGSGADGSVPPLSPQEAAERIADAVEDALERCPEDANLEPLLDAMSGLLAWVKAAQKDRVKPRDYLPPVGLVVIERIEAMLQRAVRGWPRGKSHQLLANLLRQFADGLDAEDERSDADHAGR